ncbi:MAG: HupE/UreJ family protein [Pseudomonadota bacterium]
MGDFSVKTVAPWIIALAAMLMFTGTAHAHRSGESYVYLNVTEDSLAGKIHVRLAHLDQELALDADGDGTVAEEEFEARQAEIYAFFEDRLTLYEGEEVHPVLFYEHVFIYPEGAGWASLRFRVPSVSTPPETMDAEYRFLFDETDPTHRGLLIIESNTRAGISENEAQHSLIFRPGRERQSFRVDGIPDTTVFGRFVGEGVYHIVPIGYDHILFLISLLLPSVLLLQSGRYRPAPGFRAPFWHVVKIVSFFTIAHTITLTLATLNIVQLPSRFVEAVIALSIAIVALNNLRPFMEKYIWTIVFTLGLFHGFGFANVLDPFAYRKIALAPALAGFNIGVEIGQLIVVFAVFPVLYLLRNQKFYIRYVLGGGSILLMAIALFWFFERTLFGG